MLDGMQGGLLDGLLDGMVLDDLGGLAAYRGDMPSDAEMDVARREMFGRASRRRQERLHHDKNERRRSRLFVDPDLDVRNDFRRTA